MTLSASSIQSAWRSQSISTVHASSIGTGSTISRSTSTRSSLWGAASPRECRRGHPRTDAATLRPWREERSTAAAMASAARHPSRRPTPRRVDRGGVGVAWDDDGAIVYAGPVDGLPGSRRSAPRPGLHRARLRRLPHAPAVRRLARRRVRGAAARRLVPGAARWRRRHLPVGAHVRRGERRRGARVLATAARRDARARHDRARAEDRLRPLGRTGAARGPARAPARRRGAQTCSVTLLAAHAVPARHDVERTGCERRAAS